MKDFYKVEVIFSSGGLDRNPLQARSLELEADEFTRGRDSFLGFARQGEKLAENIIGQYPREYDRYAVYAIPEAVRVEEKVRADPFFVSHVKVTGFARDTKQAEALEARLKAPFGQHVKSRILQVQELTASPQ